MLNNYDYNQLIIIVEKINLFRKKNLSLHDLINDLSALVDVLENVDSDWKNEYRKWWAHLEEVYAVALYHNKDLDEDDWQIITKALNQIENLIIYLLEKELIEPIHEIKEMAMEINEKWLMCPFCQEAWESKSEVGMVRCPKCNNLLHNPRYKRQ